MSRITKTELELKNVALTAQIEELQAQVEGLQAQLMAQSTEFQTQLSTQAQQHVHLMAEQAKDHRKIANEYAEERFQAGWTAGALGQKANKPIPEVYTKPIAERKEAMAWHKALPPKIRSTMTKLPDIHAAWKARA